MLCDDCINVIMRTTQNGTQDPVTIRVCDLDGASTTYQLKECSRKEIMKSIPTEIGLAPKECLHHATLEAGGTLRDDKCVVCGWSPLSKQEELEDLSKLRNIGVYKNKRPKGKPRGKRGT